MADKAEKRETVEDVARREAEAARAQAQARAEHVEGAARVAREVPSAFFELCGIVREQVRRFNAAADPQRRLVWRESPALAAGEVKPDAELHCSLGRTGGEAALSLTALGRAGRPDVYLIEIFGQLHSDRFAVRAEGYIKKSKVEYRISIDGRRVECPLDELGERLVLAVVKSDYNQLYRA
jgi:hypothetical protein